MLKRNRLTMILTRATFISVCNLQRASQCCTRTAARHEHTHEDALNLCRVSQEGRQDPLSGLWVHVRYEDGLAGWSSTPVLQMWRMHGCSHLQCHRCQLQVLRNRSCAIITSRRRCTQPPDHVSDSRALEVGTLYLMLSMSPSISEAEHAACMVHSMCI